MLKLLGERRFLPFFICQFCGALNDNTLRLALVAMLSFGALQSDSSAVFIQLSAALFMLPFFLLSAAAGDIADRVSKQRMLVATKIAEVAITAVAAAAIMMQSLPLIMLCLLLAGCQSAFFGPLKYALLPALLEKKELLNGNAWFSVSTFAAILIGTILGTVGGKSEMLAPALCGGLVALSAIGLLAAARVPLARAPAAALRFAPLASFRGVFAAATADRFVFRCILAGSWFWLVGVLLLNELALLPYRAYTDMLIAVLLGVGIGAVLCRAVFRGAISTRYAPLALLAGGVLLFFISGNMDIEDGGSDTALAAAVAAFAAVMTLYVVPVRTAVQARAAAQHRAKIIAAYNIFNALFVVLATLIAATLHAVGGDGASQTVLLLACALSIAGFFPALSLLPIESVRRLLAAAFRLLFRVEVRGLEHLEEKSTLISNHQSLWDGPLLAAFLQSTRHQLGFAIDVEQSKQFLTRQLLKLVHSYPINPMEPQGVRALIRDVQGSEEEIMPLVFPEGRITVSGGIMKSYPGASIIAEKVSGGKFTPVIIDGAQYSTLSRLRGKLRQRWFPKITITVFPPRRLQPPPKLRGNDRRQWLSQQMSYAMEESLLQVRQRAVGNLTARFADSARRYGASASLFAEFPMRRLSYRQTFLAACALGAALQKHHAPQTHIGMLLPSSVGAAVCLYAAAFRRLTPVFLNPSAGSRASLSACRTTCLETVYTSQRLLERSPPTARIVEAIKEAGIKVVLLEDLRAQISAGMKIKALLGAFCMPYAVRRLPGYAAAPDEHAAVLFTSGSEGAPKGVALSHKNLLTNCEQVLARLDLTQQDIMFNALPVFHSFGLLAGVVLPMAAGAEAWQYPTPLHYKLIPEAIYGVNATIFFSANTFLQNYGHAAHPADFRSLRLVFAGAEKLRDSTRRLWLEKFGVRILEGYGVTETSPVLAVNSPLHNVSGTVGRLLPGIAARIEPVEGVAEGGCLHVRGDNIMQGYFTADAPGELKPPPDGWHNTGDIVRLDAHNYLSIIGRAKRFIKVAGEMVPLDSVEEFIRQRREGMFAAVGVADEKRGQQLALMGDTPISREEIAALLRENGLPELWLPRDIKIVPELPLLTTGKIDYPAVARAFTAADSSAPA